RPDAWRAGAGDHGNGLDEGAVSPVDVDAILAAIAGIDEPIATEHDAVGMAAVTSRELAGPGAHAAHLAEELPGAVEDDHPVVPVAVGDVDAAPLTGDGVGVRIDGDVGGQIEECLTAPRLIGVDARPRAAGEVGTIAQELGPDLQQHGLAVVGVLLHDAVVTVAADPEVALVVDEA